MALQLLEDSSSSSEDSSIEFVEGLAGVYAISVVVPFGPNNPAPENTGEEDNSLVANDLIANLNNMLYRERGDFMNHNDGLSV